MASTAAVPAKVGSAGEYSSTSTAPNRSATAASAELQRVGTRHVRGEACRLDALLGEPCGERVELVLGPGDQGDLETLPSEAAGDGQAQAWACPDDGDDGHG